MSLNFANLPLVRPRKICQFRRAPKLYGFLYLYKHLPTFTKLHIYEKAVKGGKSKGLFVLYSVKLLVNSQTYLQKPATLEPNLQNFVK